MTGSMQRRIGFACAYTPLPLIDAAGFVPFRILPIGSAPDQAGSLLHDNMCPHVKRILDRALAADLPELAGVVFMNSCDAMRRLADAWQAARPGDHVTLVDLPVTGDGGGAAYLAGELGRLADCLKAWGGRQLSDEAIAASAARYRELAMGLASLQARCAAGTLPGGRRALQAVLNRSVTAPVDESLADVRRLADESGPTDTDRHPVPVYLFGNVLPDPEAFALFDSCGAHVIADDLCTGSRQLVPLTIDGGADAMLQLATGILARPPCPRTLDPAAPGSLGAQVVAGASACGARGVIAYVMKFCDPYLGRLPAVREALREAGLPLLILEGDCTLRSLGQHRTRIEAFVEMLGGNP